MIGVVLGILAAALLLTMVVVLTLDVTPRCPKCGAEAKVLGLQQHVRWWYCPACNRNPWREEAKSA